MAEKKIISKRTVKKTRKRVKPLKGRKKPLKARKGTRTKVLGTYQALWDCASCDTKGNPGLKKTCPTCGSPKEDEHNEIYYEDKELTKRLTKKEMDEAGISAEHNSDLDCRYCGATLKPNAEKCPICGAPTKEEKKEQSSSKIEKESASTETKPPEKEPELPPKPQNVKNVASSNEKKSFPWKIIGIIAFLIFSCCGILTVIGVIGDIASTEVMDLSDASWEYQIAIEEEKEIEKEGWELPKGSELIEKYEKKKGTKKVKTGEEEKEVCRDEQVEDGFEEVCTTEHVTYDDGTTDVIETCEDEPMYRTEEVCEMKTTPVYKDEPVYETWYEYIVFEWVKVDTKKFTGSYPELPETIEVELTDKQRKGEASGTYVLEFKDESNSIYIYETNDLEEYKNFKPGQRWKVSKNLSENTINRIKEKVSD